MKSKQNLPEILSMLDKAITQMEDKKQWQSAGIIRSIKDGVMEIENISGLTMGEVVTIEETGTEAVVLQVGRDINIAVSLDPSIELRTGFAAVRTGKSLAIPVSDQIIGRVVSPLGKPLDEQPPLQKTVLMPLERVAAGVMARESVSQPVQTGILAIDSLIPIGRGQRELIIGDRQTGKTAIALDTIINQKGQNMICVYVAVGQRDSKTAQVIKTLTDTGAMQYTVVVSASAGDPAIVQFLAPYAGAAIAEFFLAQGKDVLVVYDDLSKHAIAYREVSLLLRKPPGREAYPGDVFYIHSRLLERAVKLNPEHGGGSITALPIIETQAGDVSAYIPTNVISITDGQIFLEPGLFYRGIRPAINVGISVSRVGSAAQTHIMKKLSGSAKLDLAQYYELAAFAQFASELDASSKKQLTRGERLIEALKQKQNRPRPLWQECAVLYATLKGYVDETPTAAVADKLIQFLEHVESFKPQLVTTIETGKTLTPEVESELAAAATDFFKK